MKLRILDDSIRLRLDRDEVDRIGADEAVSCTTRFPDGRRFVYRLEAGARDADAGFDGDALVLRLPRETLQAWAGDETRVGIREELPLAEGALKLLVEKDFECLEPRDGETTANRFPNPKSRS